MMQHSTLSRPHLDWLLDAVTKLNVIVIGDAILDCYLEGFSDRLCQEAPVPVVNVTNSEYVPGGAANTAVNVRSLGGQVTFVSVIGDDWEGSLLKQALSQRGIASQNLVIQPCRQTLTKQRVVASSQILVRFDSGTIDAIDEYAEQALIDELDLRYPDCDAVIVSDYGYGILTARVIEKLSQLQAHHKHILVVDAKNLAAYRHLGITAVKPNYEQVLKLLNIPPLKASHENSISRIEQIIPYEAQILHMTGATIAAVTLDADGGIIFERDSQPHRTYTQPTIPSRTPGAGDTFVSALTLALGAGVATPQAADFAAAAAAVVVAKDGTTACYREELREFVGEGDEGDKEDRGDEGDLFMQSFQSTKSVTSTWELAENVLCVRLDTIGDVLMTTPAIRALKVANPRRRITLLTSSAGAAIGSLVPEIDEVIVYDAPWLKATASRVNSRPEYEMAERLRRLKFDGAVIFTVYSQNPLPSAFVCYLADIPLRLAHCHENPYQLLTNWVKDPEPEKFVRHEVRRQLDLVGTIGCYTDEERLSLHVPKEALVVVEGILQNLGIDRQHPLIVIHPGATAASRRYSPEKFALVAKTLVLDMGRNVVFTGTESEQELVAEIERVMMAGDAIAKPFRRKPAKLDDLSPISPNSGTIYSLVGCLRLSELAALLQLSSLLISNNTGPVHIAAAVGTPVVDLYALTNPQHTPWSVPNRVLFHDVPCKYCYKSICPEGHHECLSLVTPESVVNAACELLAAIHNGLGTEHKQETSEQYFLTTNLHNS
jgi:rfaE bifunctional protein kinase chain/domain